jgi:transcriptional regulator
MYIPQHNEEKRIPVLHQLIRAEPLAALVTLASTGLFATHLPMVLESTPDGLGILRGHVARANPQWRDLDPAVDALAIFSGPQHYITPTWYPGTYEHGKEVPTWNYVVVHAYGPLRIIHDEHWLLTHLEQLTAQSEPSPAQVERNPIPSEANLVPSEAVPVSSEANPIPSEPTSVPSEAVTVLPRAGVPAIPWKLSDAPADFIRSLLHGIVGFELPIHRLEGKWKVSQNRTTSEKQGVIAGLSVLDTPASLVMKSLVAERS